MTLVGHRAGRASAGSVRLEKNRSQGIPAGDTWERLMSRLLGLPILGMAVTLAAPAAQAQVRPYIGFVYPAGGQQGTTFQAKLGGQNLDGVHAVVVTGRGVSARVVEYLRKLGPQEVALLREQLNELRGASRTTLQVSTADTMMTSGAARSGLDMMAAAPGGLGTPGTAGAADLTRSLMARIEKRLAEYVNRPACISISNVIIIEVRVAADAEPGQRELRLVTLRGVSNPLFFHVGQLREYARRPMPTSEFQVLGKEEQALRKRPPEEAECRITLPCVVNGQIASGEVNRYRFQARQGQRLVLSAAARQLIPYIADAVPGWFQPVLSLHDAAGKELAYNDDYLFRPDPMILFEVPRDGEYVFQITDAIYRGREDFVYRVTAGELPVVTSIFPLGGRAGDRLAVAMKGWNLDGAELMLPAADAGPGVHFVAARRQGLVSNRLRFVLDTLPECRDREPNEDPPHAQKVDLPTIVNGRVDRADDWDVFRIEGRAGEAIVAEVSARRLDSPLDATLRITDAAGNLLAFNDDHWDVESGLNTHHADSYLRVQLPADGAYYVHLGDTARKGGEEYAYRLRISRPRPDFALRVVPSSIALRSRGSAAFSVYAIRKDGFGGPIQLGLKDPPAGFFAPRVTLGPTQEMARLTVRTNLVDTPQPVTLRVEGRAKIQQREVAHEAVPAEDRMQAFLWRHLVPADDLKALVFDPSYEPPLKRVRPPAAEARSAVASAAPPPGKPTFTKQQVAGRLRQIKLLYDEWLLTDEFNDRKVAECAAAQ